MEAIAPKPVNSINTPRRQEMLNTTPFTLPKGLALAETLSRFKRVGGRWHVLLAIFLASVLFVTGSSSGATLVPEELAEGKVIVLDPGHGGHDVGARWASDRMEKEMTLNLAFHLKQALHGICRVELTREGDYWIDLQKRTTLANRHQADVFITLHSSGSSDPTAKGVRVFYHGGEGQQFLSSRDEEDLREAGDGPSPWDRVQTAHASRSRILATVLHERFVKQRLSTARDIFKAPLYVLKGANCPAVLLETDLLTPDRLEVDSPPNDTLDMLVEAIAEALNAYFGKSASCIEAEDVIEEDLGAGRGAAW